MAEINVANNFGFAELAKRVAPGDKNLLQIMEAMTEQLPMLEDIPMFKCNQLFSEKINRRTSLPTGTWRKAYLGVTKKASTTQTVTFPTALLEARSEVDEAIVDGSPDPDGTRRSEDVSFTEGMGQQVADAFIEGTDVGNPERIQGLYEYLNDLDLTTVFDGGNAGGTSVIAVDWSHGTTYGIYPGAAANRGPLGLSSKNKGKEPIDDGTSTNAKFYAYVTQFLWWIGLVVRDEFAIGRYCNLNPTIGGSNGFNEDKMIELLEVGHFNPKRTVLYVNSLIRAQMRIRLKNKANVNFNQRMGLSGSPILTFAELPVKRHDAIKTDEDTVTS